MANDIACKKYKSYTRKSAFILVIVLLAHIGLKIATELQNYLAAAVAADVLMLCAIYYVVLWYRRYRNDG